MSRPAAPLFLAKSGYRRRRLNDAARLLPVFGLFLILLPILWGPDQTPRPDTASDGLYLFGVWAGLILAAAALAPGLRRNAGPEVEPAAEAATESAVEWAPEPGRDPDAGDRA